MISGAMLAVKCLANRTASSPLPEVDGFPCLISYCELGIPRGLDAGSKHIPDEQSVQIEVRPLLGLPPVCSLAIGGVALISAGRESLCYGAEQDSAPSNVDLLVAQMRAEFHLQHRSALSVPRMSYRVEIEGHKMTKEMKGLAWKHPRTQLACL